MESNLPPDVAAKVAKAREYQSIAVAIHEAIQADGLTIENLSVAFSGGLAILSGIASRQTDSERAGQIASLNPDVQQVNNEIIVR
jgi:osmotically-inducible protein OsmY